MLCIACTWPSCLWQPCLRCLQPLEEAPSLIWVCHKGHVIVLSRLLTLCVLLTCAVQGCGTPASGSAWGALGGQQLVLRTCRQRLRSCLSAKAVPVAWCSPPTQPKVPLQCLPQQQQQQQQEGKGATTAPLLLVAPLGPLYVSWALAAAATAPGVFSLSVWDQVCRGTGLQRCCAAMLRRQQLPLCQLAARTNRGETPQQLQPPKPRLPAQVAAAVQAADADRAAGALVLGAAARRWQAVSSTPHVSRVQPALGISRQLRREQAPQVMQAAAEAAVTPPAEAVLLCKQLLAVVSEAVGVSLVMGLVTQVTPGLERCRMTDSRQPQWPVAAAAVILTSGTQP
jgi:hypothetical protein